MPPTRDHAVRAGLPQMARGRHTWRGPRPTLTGGRGRMLACLRRAIEMPVVGEGPYCLSLRRPVRAHMMRAPIPGALSPHEEHADQMWPQRS